MRIYVDFRCLQDPEFADRGVGRHTAGIVQNVRKHFHSPLEIIGLLDPALPQPSGDRAALADRLQASWAPLPGGAVFLQTSPMTHDGSQAAPFLSRRDILSTTIVYDFIPLESPEEFLPTPALHRQYTHRLAWLRKYDLFFPISQYSAEQLRERLSVDARRITVTGAGVRLAFREATSDRSATPNSFPFRPDEYFALGGGQCARKNIDSAVMAHAQMHTSRPVQIGLAIVGNFTHDYQRRLRALHRQHGAPAGSLAFIVGVSDQELAAIYRQAIGAIAPSRMEGFDLPVVEAISCGCPVVVSDIPVHRELVEQPEARFRFDDVRQVARLLARLLDEPAWARQLAARQAPAAARFSEAVVAGRCWSRIAQEWQRRRTSPASIGPRKPRLAFLTPYPPDQTGVADYTAASLRHLANHAVIDVFTDAPNVRRDPWIRRFLPISEVAHHGQEYDRVVTVAGNHSHFHRRPLDVHLRYGGPVVSHDNRMADYYCSRYGVAEFRLRASRKLNRPVGACEAMKWLDEPSFLPTLFFDELIDRADPFIVHSRGIQRQIQRDCGVHVEYLPFCCHRQFADGELSDAARQAARRRLGLPDDQLSVVSFGVVAPNKGFETLIMAIEQLRARGWPAHLYFVGPEAGYKAGIQPLLKRLRLAEAVHFASDWVSETGYRDFLLAADLGVQLRSHAFGGLSGALLDCITAGLPTVSNEDLAAALEGPDYVLRIADQFSPLLIAERLAELLAADRHRVRLVPERGAYVRTHSFARYAREMMQLLKVA